MYGKQFLRIMAAAASIWMLWASPGMCAGVNYPSKIAPANQKPEYKGEFHEVNIPATLDLNEMAALAINPLVSCTDPDYDDEIYMWVVFDRKPPVMSHDWHDWNIIKFWEGLPLMRAMTGITDRDQVDQVWRDVILKSIGPDGLFYVPLEGRPWARLNPWFAAAVWRNDGTTTSIENEAVKFVTTPHVCGRVLGAMSVNYLTSRDPIWKQSIERMVDRMNEVAIKRGDYAYHPLGVYEPGAKFAGSPKMPIGFLSSLSGWTVQGLAQAYAATGYEPARDLAAKLSRYMRFQGNWFDADGKFLVADQYTFGTTAAYSKNQYTKYGGHFHHHTLPMLGMLEYAIIANDRDMLKFVDGGFRYAREQGSTRTGFFPENIEPDYPTVEACEVADMIALAVKLSEAGVADHWDDVDRWVRNQFHELQMRSTDWPDRWNPKSKPVAANETGDRVAERNLGAFFGWSRFNDGASNMMHCCIGNASRAIYYVWKNILSYDAKSQELTVNLLMNRASPWADLDSFVPYQGRAVLHLKRDARSVRVHVPEWIASGDPKVKVLVGGEERRFEWSGKYVVIADCRSGQDVEISFPINEQRVKERIGGTDFEMTIRGNTVVEVDPPGRTLPLYQREYLRQDEPLWRRTKRFTPDEILNW